MNFKIRCSAIGQIMTNPRTKKAQEAGELSATAKTYCENWLKEQLYGLKKDISSKYLEKGIEVEQDSIELLDSHLNQGMLFKNEHYKENEFLTGTPDIVLNDMIIDVKSSWDCFTFPLFETEITNKVYYWQLQGYMELFDKPKAMLAYCLVDTPEFIEDDAHSYDNVPVNLRIKTFEIERNQEAIKQVKARVEQCQNYINFLNSKL